jgi:hypothetical protein
MSTCPLALLQCYIKQQSILNFAYQSLYHPFVRAAQKKEAPPLQEQLSPHTKSDFQSTRKRLFLTKLRFRKEYILIEPQKRQGSGHE